VPADNGPAAVDGGGHQIIGGGLLTNQAADAPHLAPMVAPVPATTGQTPAEWSADSGSFSAANVAVLEGSGSMAPRPPNRQPHAEPRLPAAVAHMLAASGTSTASPPTESAVQAALRARWRTDAGRRAYARRKQTVAPVFGQITERPRLRRFLRRGLAKGTGEGTRWCLPHNLRRIIQACRADPALRRRVGNG